MRKKLPLDPTWLQTGKLGKREEKGKDASTKVKYVLLETS